MAADAMDIPIIRRPIMQNNTPIEILEALKNSNSPICCIDSRLDFDAFCSALAFRIFMKSIGKDLKLTWSQGDLPDRYKNLLLDITPKYGDIDFNVDPSVIDFSKYDLLVYLDAGNDYHISVLREGEFLPPKNIKSINIDHHSANPLYGTLNYVQPVPSTCSVLYELFKTWGYAIEQTTAKLLLLGLYTDSMSFQIDSVNGNALRVAADLVDLSQTALAEFSRKLKIDTIEDVKIKQIVFKNIRVNFNGRYTYSFAEISDFNEYGLEVDDKTVPPVDLYKSLQGMEYVFFIKEKKRAVNYSVSFRSVNADYDVSAIATKLGGGGHKMAAACSINANSIEEVVDIVIETATQIQLELAHE